MTSNFSCRIISIHALREEGDYINGAFVPIKQEFLSTPSARRATQRHGPPWQRAFYFYPRPPRGGRPSFRTFFTAGAIFLSTPSARRATTLPKLLPEMGFNFYPRPPRGGRHEPPRYQLWLSCISIHALREEGDQVLRARGHLSNGISIHALREEGDPRTNC